MKVKEIDDKIAALQAERTLAVKIEAEQAAMENYVEICGLVPQVVKLLEKLHKLGYTAPRLATALTNEAGNYKPGQYIKRPRNPMGGYEEPEEV